MSMGDACPRCTDGWLGGLDAEGHRTCFHCGYVAVPAPVAMRDGDEAEGIHSGITRDRGCKVSPSCLACPLERCVEDLTPADQTQEEYLHRMRERYGWVVELADGGLGPREIAARLGVSPRTVARAKEWGAGTEECEQSNRKGIGRSRNRVHTEGTAPTPCRGEAGLEDERDVA